MLLLLKVLEILVGAMSGAPNPVVSSYLVMDNPCGL